MPREIQLSLPFSRLKRNKTKKNQREKESWKWPTAKQLRKWKRSIFEFYGTNGVRRLVYGHDETIECTSNRSEGKIGRSGGEWKDHPPSTEAIVTLWSLKRPVPSIGSWTLSSKISRRTDISTKFTSLLFLFCCSFPFSFSQIIIAIFRWGVLWFPKGMRRVNRF